MKPDRALERLAKDRSYELIKDDFAFTLGGAVEINGFGTKEPYLLERELDLR